MSSPTAAFDRVAREYGDLWSNTDAGRMQREAFWRRVVPLFRAGERVLDLGCGTGDDALFLARHGVETLGIDVSPEMVRIAKERGVNARLCRIEEIGSLQRRFDGAISDFGALNCVRRLADLREPLARLIGPGGHLAICVMGRFCLWETAWYLVRGDFRRAVRRWKGLAASSLGVEVFYPTVNEIERSLAPAFSLVETAGIGIYVPPSYAGNLPRAILGQLDRIDRRIAGWPVFRAVSDHRLLIFRRT